VGRPVEGTDLRGALVAAALELLEQTGDPSAVSVAAIVDAVGCSPPTLYHYWPHRSLLLREASALGFGEFRRLQTDAVGAHPDPLTRIRWRGHAYLEFALTRPSLFRVLFLDPPVEASPAASIEAPGDAFQNLIDDVNEAMAAGQLAVADPLVVAVGLWAATHGVAALWLANPEIPRELARTVAEAQSHALLLGYSAKSQD
jgi:AcrR family transcriptional regulator